MAAYSGALVRAAFRMRSHSTNNKITIVIPGGGIILGELCGRYWSEKRVQLLPSHLFRFRYHCRGVTELDCAESIHRTLRVRRWWKPRP